MGKLPQRRLNRLPGYDYSQNGAYFVTMCTKNRAEVLSRIENGIVALTEYGEIIKDEIEIIPLIRKECIIDKFVIMPNHIHIIVRLVGDDGNRPVSPHTHCVSGDAGGLPSAPTVSNMVKGFKGAVTRSLGFSLWQRSFHDHIIRDENDYLRIAEYVENNPVNWETDCFYPQKEAES
jgi:REP element-mobilizing transposase RayT